MLRYILAMSEQGLKGGGGKGDLLHPHHPQFLDFPGRSVSIILDAVGDGLLAC